MSERAHIGHMHGPWDVEQCSRRKFSISSQEKCIFKFRSVKNYFFCEAATKKAFQKLDTQAYKNNIFFIVMHISFCGDSFRYAHYKIFCENHF
jgi:hypothetical protein